MPQPRSRIRAVARQTIVTGLRGGDPPRRRIIGGTPAFSSALRAECGRSGWSSRSPDAVRACLTRLGLLAVYGSLARSHRQAAVRDESTVMHGTASRSSGRAGAALVHTSRCHAQACPARLPITSSFYLVNGLAKAAKRGCPATFRIRRRRGHHHFETTARLRLRGRATSTWGVALRAAAGARARGCSGAARLR